MYMENPMEQSFLEEIIAFIQNSSLSDEDKNVWIKSLKNATPEIAISLLSYFQDFPDKVQWATDMFKRKVQALKTKDENAWNQILAEEEQELAQLTQE